jgi:hypothetical protein
LRFVTRPLLGKSGNSEIQDLDETRTRDEKILRSDVAMDNAAVTIPPAADP